MKPNPWLTEPHENKIEKTISERRVGTWGMGSSYGG